MTDEVSHSSGGLCKLNGKTNTEEPPAKKYRSSQMWSEEENSEVLAGLPLKDGLQYRDFWDEQVVQPHADISSSSGSRTSDWSVDYLREQMVGYGQPLQTPFGSRRMLYADFTASGRPLKLIEAYLVQQVMPLYANTHTTTSLTGLQSTCFRVEARQIIAEAINARIRDKDEHSDVIIFTGSGATGALNKLVSILQLPALLHAGKRCVVFVGPHEHHSNLLPWREVAGLELVTVCENQLGQLDIADLKAKLEAHQDYDKKIGSFSAASNVTGVVADIDAITELLHQHGALAFWDYATAAPHMKVDMNPTADRMYAKDAIFLSPHKLIGGPGSPGILAVKRKLLSASPIPSQPGGGTVFFVTEESHTYLRNAEEREEGGTPDVIGSIRTGCAFHVRSMIGLEVTERLDMELSAHLIRTMPGIPHLVVLGPLSDKVQRLPIVSFMIVTPWDPNRYLHHSFVCAILNDLFGIQVRGGCMCAGPYSLHLLGINQAAAKEFEAELATKNNEPIRPGYVRLSLPFFTSQAERQYILDALHEIAAHGWALLPQYRFSSRTGEWRHMTLLNRFPTRRWISKMPLSTEEPISLSAPSSEVYEVALKAQLEEAKATLQAAIADCPSARNPDGSLEEPFAHHLRWFALPSDAVRFAKGLQVPLAPAILQPRDYTAAALACNGANAACTEPQSACSTATCNVVCRPSSVQEGMCPLSRTFLVPKDAEHKKPPKRLMRLIGEAVRDFDLIQNGDRLLLGLSGGKDSLCLLHCLLELQKRAPIKFTIAGATVNPGIETSFNPRPLIQYMQQLNVPYHFLETTIYEDAQSGKMDGDSICSFCSRMRRGVLYGCCRENNYNKLVLAQHLDDLAESFFMSAMRNGQIRTMKAKYTIEAGDIVVIRPLVYVREAYNREFAYNSGLPVINENCPACFEMPKERARVKKMLAKEEAENSNLFHSLKRGLRPLMLEEVHEVHRTAAESLVKIRSLHTRYATLCAKGKDEVTQNQSNMTEVGDATSHTSNGDTVPLLKHLEELSAKDEEIQALKEQLALMQKRQADDMKCG